MQAPAPQRRHKQNQQMGRPRKDRWPSSGRCFPGDKLGRSARHHRHTGPVWVSPEQPVFICFQGPADLLMVWCWIARMIDLRIRILCFFNDQLTEKSCDGPGSTVSKGLGWLPHLGAHRRGGGGTFGRNKHGAGGCFGRPSSKPLLAAANEFASWGSVASIPPMGQRLNRALEKDASSIFQRCFYMVLYKQVVVHFQLVGVGWIWIWRELRF